MFVPALILSMVIVILWGNGSTIIAFILRKKLRENSSYWFIVSLSVLDFFTGFLVIPFVFYFNWNPDLIADQTICDINMVLHFVFVSPTVHHLMVISADRYFKLISPLKYKSIVTVRRTVILIAILWVGETILGLLMLIPDHSFGRNCFVLKITVLSESNIHAFPGLLATFLLNIPIMFLVFFNIRTYIIASNFNKVISKEISNNPGDHKVYIRYNLGKIVVETCNSSDSSDGENFREWFKTTVKNKKLSLLIGMIVVSAAGCWIPATIMYHIKHVYPDWTGPWFLQIHPWFMYLNSAFNPFILLALNEDFRSGYKQVYGIPDIQPSCDSNRTPQPNNRNLRPKHSLLP